MKFTPEEIEEMRRADEEIERDFRWTRDELAASRSRDAEATIFQKDTRCRSIAEYQKAYREANKDSIAEKQRAYYEANKDSIAEYQKAYREANKDSIAEKQRWIREARLARGFSQRRLAMEIGVNQPSISLLESGGLKLDSFRAKHALFAALGAK